MDYTHKLRIVVLSRSNHPGLLKSLNTALKEVPQTPDLDSAGSAPPLEKSRAGLFLI